MKFNKMLSILIVFIITMTLYGCPDDFGIDALRINNESADTLCVFLASGFVSAYPDTIIPKYSTELGLAVICPNSILELLPGGNRLYKYIFKERLPQDTLSVFIFKLDTLIAYNWNIIRRDYKISVRYDLSYPDLKSLGFAIPYPPTEMMKDMKMYPGYGSVLASQ